VFHDCTCVARHLRNCKGHPMLCQEWGNDAGVILCCVSSGVMMQGLTLPLSVTSDMCLVQRGRLT
jgi:hypothetical protein